MRGREKVTHQKGNTTKPKPTHTTRGVTKNITNKGKKNITISYTQRRAQIHTLRKNRGEKTQHHNMLQRVEEQDGGNNIKMGICRGSITRRIARWSQFTSRAVEKVEGAGGC